MSHIKNSAIALGIISFLLILLLLSVSVYHAGSFMWRTSGEGWQRYAMIATVFGLLASSHCLAHYVGQGIKQGLIIVALLCGTTVIPIELFSIATSSAALNSRVVDSVRRENQSSPEYKRAEKNVANLQRQLDGQFIAVGNLPADQGTNIRKANAAIAVTQSKIEQAQLKANQINVSTTGAVYSSLESSTGLSASDVSGTAAVMLSITPLVLGIGWAALSGSTRRRKVQTTNDKADTGKKPSRRLHAV